ncbi:MAG: Flagellin protein FlaA, partial [uncultured Sphingomonadaceae bacterium]
MASVNTNVGAMAALQSLNATSKNLATTQSRINTGLNVASTKDDSASFTIAQTLRGDLGSLKAVGSSLSRAKSTTDVAVAGAEQISDLVNEMKAKATQASGESDTDARAALALDFDALKARIATIIDSSEFSGVNLLKTAGGEVKALQSTKPTAATLDVVNQGFDTVVTTAVGASGATATPTDFSDPANAKGMVDKLGTLSKEINTRLSALGSASRQIDGQSTFVSKLSDTIEGGICNLVDADLAKESAKLQSLQVKQQ